MATPSEEFLTKKVGPLPVYGWGGVALALAWLYAKYQAKASANSSSTSSTDSSAAEPASGAPYYVIENNLPGGGPNTAGVVSTPAGTSSAPPTTTPGNPIDSTTSSTGSSTTSSTSPPSSSTTSTPAVQKYVVQRGDTLWGIAQKLTGNGANDTKIWAYNTPAARKAAGLPPVQGNSMSLIYAGETFLIPPK